MRIKLPDVNILIALHDPQHPGHNIAHEWFEREGQYGWARGRAMDEVHGSTLSSKVIPVPAG